MKRQRYGAVIGLRDECEADYRRVHAAVWPAVLAQIKASHLENYSIFLRRMPDGRLYLFSYCEYTGDDFAGDMAKMAADPVTQEWWTLCKPMQAPFPDRADGEWWATAEEVFHCD